jgi:hypothetical protein
MNEISLLRRWNCRALLVAIRYRHTLNGEIRRGLADAFVGIYAGVLRQFLRNRVIAGKPVQVPDDWPLVTINVKASGAPSRTAVMTCVSPRFVTCNLPYRYKCTTDPKPGNVV